MKLASETIPLADDTDTTENRAPNIEERISSSMKVRVVGFRALREILPPKMTACDVYQALKANAGKPVGQKGLIRAAADQVTLRYDEEDEAWWAGLILRARNAQTFNQLTETDGKLELTAKQLTNAKIAEISFFLANPRSGSGLLASYHNAPSFSVLKTVFKQLFTRQRHLIFHEKLKEAGNDKKLQKAAHKDYKGKCDYAMITHEGTLKDIFKQIKKVSAVKVHFSTVITKESDFQRTTSKALTETAEYTYPPECLFDDDFAEELASGIDEQKLNAASVRGFDETGTERTISSDIARNKLLFAEEAYDNLLNDLSLDLQNWEGTIHQSKVIKWLIKTAKNDAVRLLLEK